MVTKLTKDECTSCGACAAICPRNCIKMQSSVNGQLVPKIDRKRCINCGMCEKTCPQKRHVEMHNPLSCYAAWSKNENDLIHSASGGIGVTFARWLKAYGGVVFGCDYSSQAELQHFQVETDDDLERIRGSKYSQSNAWHVFKRIKRLLDNGEKVLFVGTPCQVAGLNMFLKKNYSGLLTVDLVCHGTPPNTYFKQYIKKLGITFPVDRITFRGEYDQMLTIWKDQKIIYQKSSKDDAYFSAFYGNIISNTSCYRCKYAQPRRVSDITIGDFWGLGELNEIERKSARASLILVNTEKGQEFFNSVKNELVCEQRTVEEGISGNGRLIAPPGEKREAVIFKRVYASKVFELQNALRITYRIVRIECFLKKMYIKFHKRFRRKK